MTHVCPSGYASLCGSMTPSKGIIATALSERQARLSFSPWSNAAFTRADRADLARRVRWVADLDGDGAGYDVLSFEPGGDERLLEVKTTNGSARTPFFLSRNECTVAAERPDAWRLYRVHLFAEGPRCVHDCAAVGDRRETDHRSLAGIDLTQPAV